MFPSLSPTSYFSRDSRGRRRSISEMEWTICEREILHAVAVLHRTTFSFIFSNVKVLLWHYYCSLIYFHLFCSFVSTPPLIMCVLSTLPKRKITYNSTKFFFRFLSSVLSAFFRWGFSFFPYHTFFSVVGWIITFQFWFDRWFVTIRTEGHIKIQFVISLLNPHKYDDSIFYMIFICFERERARIDRFHVINFNRRWTANATDGISCVFLTENENERMKRTIERYDFLSLFDFWWIIWRCLHGIILLNFQIALSFCYCLEFWRIAEKQIFSFNSKQIYSFCNVQGFSVLNNWFEYMRYDQK